MHTFELTTLLAQMRELYPDTCPHFSPAMAAVWLEDLAPIDTALVYQAMTSWVHSHSVYPPSLREFLDLIDVTREENRHAQATSLRAQQERLDALSFQGVLPSPAQTGKDRSWARLHVAMVEAGIPKPGHYEDAAALCEHYATIDVDNAPDWLAEAAWWRDGAHGRPLLPSMIQEVKMWQSAP